MSVEQVKLIRTIVCLERFVEALDILSFYLIPFSFDTLSKRISIQIFCMT